MDFPIGKISEQFSRFPHFLFNIPIGWQLQKRFFYKNIEIHNFDNSLLKDSGEESASRIIIAEIIDELAIMSVSEAADHLSEKRHVFVFKNISNDAVNVVYLREDGNVGWIDYKIG